MTDFITFVALKCADSSDLELLDRAMGGRLFTKIHVSERGVTYSLPEGIYFSQSYHLVAREVRDLAIAAATETGKVYDLVTVAGDVAYSLNPAR